MSTGCSYRVVDDDDDVIIRLSIALVAMSYHYQTDINCFKLPHLNRCHHLFCFSVAGPRVSNSRTSTLRPPDMDFGQFKNNCWRHFCLSKTAAHLWLFVFWCAVYKFIYLLTYLLTHLQHASCLVLATATRGAMRLHVIFAKKSVKLVSLLAVSFKFTFLAAARCTL